MKYLAALTVLGLVLALTTPAEATGLMWGSGGPDYNYLDVSGPSGVIFLFDTSTGVVGTTFSFESANWAWISGVADNGKYLYASHNTWNTESGYADYGDLRIAKIDRTTGAILSDTSIAAFLDQTYSQVNALDFRNGKLYGVENATWNSDIRGYAMEISLDANGDVVGATQGAFVGPYPDGGLDFHEGLWYATHWRNDSSSWVATSPDIMTTDFTSTMSTGSVGLISGLEFDAAGNGFAVSWYTNPTNVYGLDPSTWAITPLYDLGPQLPSSIVALSGLSDVVPEPVTMAGLALGIGSLATYVRRRRAA